MLYISVISNLDVYAKLWFAVVFQKVEEHHLYSLYYLHFGATRILYGVPGKYRLKCEALLKKTFPELSRHRELFHKLVSIYVSLF